MTKIDPVKNQEEKTDAKNIDVAKDDMPQTEIGGRVGPEPTRYGDWEKNGIISDF